MRRYDIIPIFFWIGLSIFVMFLSHRYGIGSFRKPGPGLMPFLLGCLLCIVSCSVLVRLVFEKYRGLRNAKEDGERIHWWRMCLTLAPMYVYAFFLEPIGYVVATFLFLIILFRIAGSKSWLVVLTGSVVAVLVTFLVFSQLGLRFPAGILKWR